MTDQAKPVLLAYDGSESSATAIAVAGRLLPHRNAVVCHVWSGASENGARVAAEGADLARAAGFEASPLAEREQRKTWRTLLDAAVRNDAAVVVTGAHGISGVGTLLGSVSTGVVHHSRLPVLVVPGTTSGQNTDGRVLLCYDGSGGSRRAITVAGEELGSRPGLVLHAWESWVAEAPALAGLSASVQGMAAELDEVADAQSADRTAEGVQVAESAGFDAEGVSRRATGPTWKAVLDTAEEYSCAAIVVGSRGLTGISAALGSVSNGVVHHSRRPVLVVPPQEEHL